MDIHVLKSHESMCCSYDEWNISLFLSVTEVFVVFFFVFEHFLNQHTLNIWLSSVHAKKEEIEKIVRFFLRLKKFYIFPKIGIHCSKHLNLVRENFVFVCLYLTLSKQLQMGCMQFSFPFFWWLKHLSPQTLMLGKIQ